VSKVLRDTVQEAGDELRALELARLDRLEIAANEVLEREHVTVSNGRIVVLGESPLPDDAPVLAAIDRLLKIQERRARLLGLDAPTKQNISISPERAAALEQLAEELGEQ
jgi:cell division septal protein FtsQ